MVSVQVSDLADKFTDNSGNTLAVWTPRDDRQSGGQTSGEQDATSARRAAVAKPRKA